MQDKKDRLKRALESNTLIDGDLRRDAMGLAAAGKWDDDGPEAADAQDDEYRYAGVEDPKVCSETRLCWNFSL